MAHRFFNNDDIGDIIDSVAQSQFNKYFACNWEQFDK